MIEEPTPWLAWRERVAEASAQWHQVGAVMRWVAGELAVACPRGVPATHRWAATGVTVRLARMRGRGRCDLSEEAPIVQINRVDNRYAQHFTVAHEIGHLLLAALPTDRRPKLSHREEEELCDDFARRVIVPPDELADALAGEMPTPEQVLRLCGSFEANPSTMVLALGTQLYLPHSAYLLARLRGHRRRPAEVGFRIEAAVGPKDLYWPQDQRIDGLGLGELARLAEEAGAGVSIKGIDEVSVRLRRVDATTSHNAMTGPAYWRAVKQGRHKPPYLLAQIDCSNLAGDRLERNDDRRSRASSPGTLVAEA